MEAEVYASEAEASFFFSATSWNGPSTGSTGNPESVSYLTEVKLPLGSWKVISAMDQSGLGIPPTCAAYCPFPTPELELEEGTAASLGALSLAASFGARSLAADEGAWVGLGALASRLRSGVLLLALSLRVISLYTEAERDRGLSESLPLPGVFGTSLSDICSAFSLRIAARSCLSRTFLPALLPRLLFVGS